MCPFFVCLKPTQMLPTRMLMILLLLMPMSAIAQRIPELRIGANGDSYPFTKGAFADTLQSEVFVKDPKIFISADCGTYKIAYYTISFLPARGELHGPYDVTGEHAHDILRHYMWGHSVHTNRFKKGDRLIIENIGAYSDSCTQIKKITFKAINILFE